MGSATIKIKTLQAHMKSIAGMGGAAVRDRHGSQHFSKMAKRRWAKKKKKVHELSK